MATSGSYDFAVTRDNLINLAHQHIGAIGEGETASSDQVTEAALILNMMVKLRQADGMPLWSIKRGTMLPVTAVSSVATNSHIVTGYQYTTISAAEASGQTVISLTAAGDNADSDQIGIELDDGSMHWTTISANGTTTTPTIATALPSAAAAGNRVYAYTASADRIQKPLRILNANVMLRSDESSRDIYVEDMRDYYALGNRTTEASSGPNYIFYDQASTATTNLDNGQVFFYPRFGNGDYVVEFTYHRPFQDFDAATENPDFPQTFFLPLMLELAALLGPKFGVPIEERQALHQEAAMYREVALSSVYPEGSLQLVPSRE